MRLAISTMMSIALVLIGSLAEGRFHQSSSMFDEMPADLASSAEQLTDGFRILDQVLIDRTGSGEDWLVFKAFLEEKRAEIPNTDDIFKWNWSKIKRYFSTETSESKPLQHLLEALHLINRLPEAVQNCGYESYEILAMNLYACNPALSRVWKMIDDFVQQHREKCSLYYQNDVDKITSRMPEERKELVEMITGSRVDDLMIGHDKFDVFSRDLRTLSVFKLFPHALEQLKGRFAADQESMIQAAKMSKEDDRITNFVLLDVWAPCELFVDTLKDVFAQARLDSYSDDESVLESRVMSFERAEDGGDFLTHWYEYRICSAILDKGQWMVIEEFRRLIASMQS